MPSTFRFPSVALVFLAVVFSPACTQKGVYSQIQHHEKTKCTRYPEPQREECEAEQERSYEEYRRARGDSLSNVP